MEAVFVYGTLKHGYRNHCIVEYSEYFADANTVDSYNFFTLGWFPAVAKTGNKDLDLYKIDGEIYKVDSRVMKDLDHLESNGQLYQRRIRDFEVLLNGEASVMKAWMYELIAETYGAAPGSALHRPDQFMISGDVASWYCD